MRSRLLPVLTAAALLVCVGQPTTAAAKDLNGRFAIGGLRNSMGQEGLSVKYWVGHLGFNILIGGASLSSKSEGETAPDAEGKTSNFSGDDTTSNIDSAIRVLFNAARAKDVNMYVGGGIGVGSVSQGYANPDLKDTSATEVGMELFLGAEYFFSNHFAVQAEVGLPIRAFVSADGPAIAGGGGGVGADGKYFGFFTPATWAAGFSFYF